LLHNKEAHLQVGNLQTTRDLTDVRDVVGAYKLLMEKGHNAEAYNICSGREVTMQFVVEQLLRFSGISIALKENEQLMRKAEQRRTCGSFQKLREHTSWQPKISLDRSLQDTLASWQERLS
jgi:GDP-4-dehydro-6-deoxy-D-mannose reductase